MGYIIMPVKYIIMPVPLTICACFGFALEIWKSCTNKLYVFAGHLHYTILPDRFSHNATADLQIHSRRKA